MKKSSMIVFTTLLSAGMVIAPMANANVYADDFDSEALVSEDTLFTDEDFSNEDMDLSFDEEEFTEETEMVLTETMQEETESETKEDEIESETNERNEAGSSFAGATTYSFGTNVSGSITTSNTVDYYKLTLTKSGRIDVNYFYYMAKSNISLYDENFSFLDSPGASAMKWNSNIQQGSASRFYYLTAGTYYFVVKKEGNYAGDYNFRIRYTATGESFDERQGNLFNTQSTAKQIQKDTIYKGQLGINDTKDIYKIVLDQSGYFEFSINSNCYRTDVNITDADNTSYVSDRFYNGSMKKGLYMKKGTYYFTLSISNSYFDSNGAYDFNYHFTSSGESFAESITSNDNTTATARLVSIGQKYKGQLAQHDDDRDYYKFTTNKSTVITLTANSQMRRINYCILNSKGTTLLNTGSIYANNTGYGHAVKSVSLPAGSYYLCVIKDDGCTGNYDFRLDQDIKYNVTYNANALSKVSGFPKTSVVYPGDQHKIISAVPVRNGYTFNGWYTKKSGGTRVYADKYMNINSNTTYYAHWTMKGGVEGFVTRMYNICLLRDPEATGYNYWISKLKSGQQTGKQVAYGFIFSNEFIGRRYNDADFVERLYESFLGRHSDPNGKQYWLNKLNSGKSREYVFNGFVDSTEFSNICKSYGIKVK